MARRNQTNAPDAPDADDPNAAASGSGSQVPQPGDATASGTQARAPVPGAKFEVPLLNDSGDDYTRWCKTVTLVLKY